MQVRIRRRFFFVIATISILMLSLNAFIQRIILPDNVKNASVICKAVGEEYQRTGHCPHGTSLRWSDIGRNFGLAIHESTKSGNVENRWNEEISLSGVLLKEPDGTERLCLSVTSSGPFGMGLALCSKYFDREVSKDHD